MNLLIPISIIFCSFTALAQSSIFKDTSLEEISNLINEHQPKDIADILRLLPSEFRSSYTLVNKSMSSQDASLMSPRAIVYGRLAKLILAFNGENSQSGYDRLEMLQFRDDSKEFELRFISFQNGQAVLSKKNPEQCTVCHGETPHPIWQSYPNWIGAFGSDQDDPFNNPDEKNAYAAFIAAARSHPRYKSLVAHTKISDFWPYQSSTSADYHHITRTNDRFGRHLAGLMSQSANQIVLQSDFYKKYPNSVLFHFLRCDATGNVSFYLAKIEILFKARFPENQFVSLYADLATISDPHDRATLELEKLLFNSPTNTWNLSLGFQANGQRFSPDENEQIDDFLFTRLLAQAVISEPDLAPYYNRWSTLQNYMYGTGLDLPQAKEFIIPYGIAAAYDQNNIYLDPTLASKACPILAKKYAAELK